MPTGETEMPPGGSDPDSPVDPDTPSGNPDAPTDRDETPEPDPDPERPEPIAPDHFIEFTEPSLGPLMSMDLLKPSMLGNIFFPHELEPYGESDYHPPLGGLPATGDTWSHRNPYTSVLASLMAGCLAAGYLLFWITHRRRHWDQ